MCTVLASPTQKSNYIEQENSCRDVCGLCDCNGFYCEDECICECSLEEDESESRLISLARINYFFQCFTDLQCIADMQKECDANGLEYELLMQDSAKERFLREIKGSSGDFSKHLVILKQKRQSATTEPTVGAAQPATTDSIVGAAQNSSSQNDGNNVGMPLTDVVSSLSVKTAVAGKTAISTLTAPKLLVLIRERLANVIKPASTRAPFVYPSFNTPAASAKFSLPSFPTFAPVQPSWLQH